MRSVFYFQHFNAVKQFQMANLYKGVQGRLEAHAIIPAWNITHPKSRPCMPLAQLMDGPQLLLVFVKVRLLLQVLFFITVSNDSNQLLWN